MSRANAATLLGAALLAAGCSPKPGDSTSVPPPLAQPAGAPAPGKSSAGLALVPLPSPQQVTASVALGRLDPFSNPRPMPPATRSVPAGQQAASQAAATAVATGGGPAAATAAAAAPASLPADFTFSGVIASRGAAEALVQSAAHSGTVKVGDVGMPSNPWLPRGWKVTAIDASQGRLTLRNGPVVRTITLS
ncbi:MAG: hypothetical protein VKN15_02980 [Cyanobacteriota bacterium]|nr:hypothetical protein [Cyanobacteriota bacterium]